MPKSHNSDLAHKRNGIQGNISLARNCVTRAMDDTVMDACDIHSLHTAYDTLSEILKRWDRHYISKRYGGKK